MNDVDFCGRRLFYRLKIATALLLLPQAFVARADSTFVYAVQASAQVQQNPAQIKLQWQPDPYGATNYIIYRKTKADTSWGTPFASLSGSSSNFTDTLVSVGEVFEYQIVKQASLGYTGYGYIFSGIQAPAVEYRGTVVLIVATESVLGLSNELSRLETDLIGDGWQIIRHDVSSNDAPQNVRALIQADYSANPTNVNSVFLFGHVPILHSGYLNYDGHGPRAMPSDAYYGEMNNDWPVSPTNSPGYLPSDVALMVGRVDLANMPGVQSAAPWPSEVELLRNYLNKDHSWRVGLLTVQRRALMGNRRGDEGGRAVAASGYRAFEPLVGPGNTVEANIEDVAPADQRWSSMLAAGSYLWAYGCGGGQNTAIGYLGTHYTDFEVWSTDIVDGNAKAVFCMVFGSHFGDWDVSDDIMRSVLATPQTGLACCMSGVPHWFFHHMGLGETIGYSTRLTMNNESLYRNQTNQFTRAVYIALMGDPTLRLDVVAPVSQLNASFDRSGVHLTWAYSGVPVVGFNIYRSASSTGLFSRVNSLPLLSTALTDATASPGQYTYMVRALSLQTNFSGSYSNLSQGIFTNITVPEPTFPILARAFAETNTVILTWPSQAGVAYHVEGANVLQTANWNRLSESVAATASSSSWSEPTTNSSCRLYRIVSP